MKAYTLLGAPGSWTQHALARDRAGNTVPPEAPEAVSYCVVGALVKAYGRNTRAAHKHLGRLGALIDTLCGTSVERWNDSPDTTHAEVINLLLDLDI